MYMDTLDTLDADPVALIETFCFLKNTDVMSYLGQSANPRGTISGNHLHHVRTKTL